MLSFKKVELRKNLYNFLTLFQRLEYHQSYRPKRKRHIKRTTAFMQNIDYARLCDYSLANLLKCEITGTSFYLTKYGFLHKHKKSELATVIKEPFRNKCLSEVLICNKKAMLMVDFMAYARQVPVKNRN